MVVVVVLTVEDTALRIVPFGNLIQTKDVILKRDSSLMLDQHCVFETCRL